jgi:hypothetical protein
MLLLWDPVQFAAARLDAVGNRLALRHWRLAVDRNVVDPDIADRQHHEGLDEGQLVPALPRPLGQCFWRIRGPCCTDRSFGGEEWTV